MEQKGGRAGGAFSAAFVDPCQRRLGGPTASMEVRGLLPREIECGVAFVWPGLHSIVPPNLPAKWPWCVGYRLGRQTI